MTTDCTAAAALRAHTHPALLARVAATPPSEWRLLAAGFTVVEDGGAGVAAACTDADRLAHAVSAGDALAALADPAAAPLLRPAGFTPTAPAGPPTVEDTRAWLARLAEVAAGRDGDVGDGDGAAACPRPLRF
jgi:hypothetical protein